MADIDDELPSVSALRSFQRMLESAALMALSWKPNKGDRFVVSTTCPFRAYAGREGVVREPVDDEVTLVKIDDDCAKITISTKWLTPLSLPAPPPDADEKESGGG